MTAEVGPFERVCTSGKALARLEELAVEAAGSLVQVDVAVAHSASLIWPGSSPDTLPIGWPPGPALSRHLAR